ncbi:MAG: hypothetical protein ACI9BH_000556 [Paracoccaceae bacterium]|jgi:hypothetical protein
METITACENVCRDFYWLESYVPTLIAAVTALVIAFAAYPWQKKKDWDNELRREQREAYRDFIEAWLKLEMELNVLGSDKTVDSPETITQTFAKINTLSDNEMLKLALCASKEVINSVSDMNQGNKKLFYDVGLKVKSILQNSPEQGTLSKKYVEEMQKLVRQARDAQRKNIGLLVTEMRKQEFDKTEAISIEAPGLPPIEINGDGT